MKLVVLDGHTLNPGDLNWQDLERLANCHIYPRTSPEEIMERCQGASIVLTNKVPLTAETIDQLPELELIVVMATGYNVVDIAFAAAKGIPVCNAAGYSTQSVAQHCFALLLGLYNRVESHNQAVTNGEWQRQGDFSFSLLPIHELSGRTIGLIGLGAIGMEVAKIAHAFGMKVLAHRKNPDMGAPEFVELVDKESLLKRSHIVSLHLPATAESMEMVNADFLAKMRPDAVLINTSRGQLVNENDLCNALKNKTIYGAALDVLTNEPPLPNNPLIGLPNCIVTPHIAWASFEARERLMEITTENVRSFMLGAPQNVVNGVK